jgi:hypothetical protein
VVKGWTAARLYAEAGLRPYGDLDLCVAPDQYGAARAALDDAVPTVDVDLQHGLRINSRAVPELPDFDEARARASHLALDGLDLVVLSPEDHLALSSVHLLSHGVWRPLWLCDVAAALERMPDRFDWGRCLLRNHRLAMWVRATVWLAERLLGARPSHPPPGAYRPPRWLERAVLRQWSLPRTIYPGDLIDSPAASFLRPRRAARLVRAHWVDPVTATMFPGASLNALPRPLYQVRFVAWKAARFLRRVASAAGP